MTIRQHYKIATKEQYLGVKAELIDTSEHGGNEMKD